MSLREVERPRNRDFTMHQSRKLRFWTNSASPNVQTRGTTVFTIVITRDSRECQRNWPCNAERRGDKEAWVVDTRGGTKGARIEEEKR